MERRGRVGSGGRECGPYYYGKQKRGRKGIGGRRRGGRGGEGIYQTNVKLIPTEQSGTVSNSVLKHLSIVCLDFSCFPLLNYVSSEQPAFNGI